MSQFAATGPIKRKAIAVSSSGDNALSISVTGRKIRVIGLLLMAAGSVTVTLRSATTSATATGAFPLTTTKDLSLLPFDGGWFDTVAGEDLAINLSGAVAVAGQLIYQEVV